MNIGESIYSAKDKTTDKNRPASLAVGVVKKNWDSMHPGKVQVGIIVDGGEETLSDWMPVAVPYAANQCGFFAMPEVGSTVVIGYIDDNSVSPVVIGSMWVGLGNAKISLPNNCADQDNEKKVFCTSNGHMIRIDEGKDSPSIEMISAKGQIVSLNDKTETILLKSGDENSIQIDGKNGKIEISAKTSLTVKIGGKEALTVDKTQTSVKSDKFNCENSMISLKGKQTALEGSSVSVKAQGDLTIQSSGMAQIKGSMLKLN